MMSDVVNSAVFAIFWVALVYGVVIERERAKGAQQ